MLPTNLEERIWIVPRIHLEYGEFIIIRGKRLGKGSGTIPGDIRPGQDLAWTFLPRTKKIISQSTSSKNPITAKRLLSLQRDSPLPNPKYALNSHISFKYSSPYREVIIAHR